MDCRPGKGDDHRSIEAIRGASTQTNQSGFCGRNSSRICCKQSTAQSSSPDRSRWFGAAAEHYGQQHHDSCIRQRGPRPAGCTHPDRGTTCRSVTRRPGNRKISIAGENRPDRPAPGHGRTSHSPFHRTGRTAPCSEQIGARRSLTHTGRTTTKGAGAGDGPPEAPVQLHERVAAGILGPSRPGHRLPRLALRHLPLRRVPPTAINVDGHIHAAGGPRKRHFKVSVEHTNYAPDGLSSVLDVARRTARTPRPRKRSRRRGTLADCGTGRGATSRSRPQTAVVKQLTVCSREAGTAPFRSNARAGSAR